MTELLIYSSGTWSPVASETDWINYIRGILETCAGQGPSTSFLHFRAFSDSVKVLKVYDTPEATVARVQFGTSSSNADSDSEYRLYSLGYPVAEKIESMLKVHY